MKVERAASAAAFLDAAGDFLMADEVRNNALLSIAGAIADGTRVLAEAPLFAVVRDAGRVLACALRTPPFKLVLSDASPAACAALASALRAEPLPGLSAPQETAAEFARAWQTLTGATARVNMRLRLHRIETMADDLPTVRGALAAAQEADRPFARAWFDAFRREATPDAPDETDAAVERFFSARRLHFWHDGVPVTMVGVVGQTANGVRVGPVYTPPEHRGGGYATAAVAALSRELLARHAYCALYTDLANPTSNGIYARIGYRPVADFTEVAFASARSGQGFPDGRGRAPLV